MKLPSIILTNVEDIILFCGIDPIGAVMISKIPSSRPINRLYFQ